MAEESGSPTADNTDQRTHREVTRGRRILGIRITLRRALLLALLAAAYVTVMWQRVPPWVVITPVAVATIIAFVAIRGAVLSERIGAVWRFLLRRRRGYDGLPGRLVEVDGCGVRFGDGYELVSAIELTADIAETRLRDGRAFAAETVPLDLLASMMTQYGIEVDIDVAAVGRRVPPGPAYRASYAQAVRFYSAVAERSTWLILRVNTQRNLDGIVRRGPSRTAGPKALMAATRRLEQRLKERQIRARVLPASELADLESLLTNHAPANLSREHWKHLTYGEAYATTYFADPLRMSTETLDRWWGVDSDSTAVVLRLRRQSAREPVEISGLVRYDTATRISDHHDTSLILVGGRQRKFALATLPGGQSSVVSLPSAPLSELRAVDIPVGPAGPVWGFSGTDAIAMPLFDGSPVPETLQVDFFTNLTSVQLILLRSVGAGGSVTVHTSRPERWKKLASTLADPLRFQISDGRVRSTADITVYDGVEIDIVPERTILTIRSSRRSVRDGKADVSVEQVSPSTVQIWFGRGAPFEVVLNPTDEELRYCEVEMAPQGMPDPPPSQSRSAINVSAPPRVEQPPTQVSVASGHAAAEGPTPLRRTTTTRWVRTGGEATGRHRPPRREAGPLRWNPTRDEAPEAPPESESDR